MITLTHTKIHELVLTQKFQNFLWSDSDLHVNKCWIEFNIEQSAVSNNKSLCTVVSILLHTKYHK